jgi:hypothetical protein
VVKDPAAVAQPVPPLTEEEFPASGVDVLPEGSPLLERQVTVVTVSG